MRPSVSIVLPAYRTRAAARELLGRLGTSLGSEPGVEIVYVDDACPEGSGDEAIETPCGSNVLLRVLRLSVNVGQQAAEFIGLAASTGDLVALMDADLQDRPEDLPLLIAHLRADPDLDAVAASRAGIYETPGRHRTARWFRHLQHLASGGRIPEGAGLFLVMRAPVAARLVAHGSPRTHPLAGLARLRCRIGSLPVERAPRPAGASAYGSWRRLVVGAGALLDSTPVHPLALALRRRFRSPVEVVETVGAARDGL